MKPGELRGNEETVNLIWCIRERVNLEVDLGSGQFRYQSRQFHGKSGYGILWGGAFKCIVLEIFDTSIAVDLQGGGWDGRGHSLDSSRADWDIRYWQGGVGVTQKIGLFAPYGAWNFNQTRFEIGKTMRLKETFQSGPIIGCTMTNGSRFSFNVEWRSWFEQGIALSGQIRF